MSRLFVAGIAVALLLLVALPGHAQVQTGKQSLPPIDCPLRRAGIDPTKLKPFQEVEKYIQFLERPTGD